MLIGLLQLASVFFPPFLLPSVDRIGLALVELVREDFDQFLLTLQRFVQALALGLVIGWAMGLVMGGLGRSVGALLEPVLKVLTATPAASWILLAVLWMADIELRILFVVTILVIPFYAVSVYEGVRRIDPGMVQAVQQFRPTRAQTVLMVLIPNSVADVMSTTRFLTGVSLRILVFAELIATTSGIGWMMTRAQSNFRVDQLLALTIAMIIMTFVLLKLLDLAEGRVLRWRPRGALR